MKQEKVPIASQSDFFPLGSHFACSFTLNWLHFGIIRAFIMLLSASIQADATVKPKQLDFSVKDRCNFGVVLVQFSLLLQQVNQAFGKMLEQIKLLEKS